MDLSVTWTRAARRASRLLSPIFMLLAIGLAALALVAGCSTVPTHVRVYDPSPAFRDSPPQSTALFALITTVNLHFPDPDSEEGEDLVQAIFHLGEAYPLNPLADVPARVEATTGIEMPVHGGAQTRPPHNLLEAYCLYRDDLSWRTRIQQKPVLFGAENYIQRRQALADSLALVAHAYALPSLEAHLDSLPELGRLEGHVGTVQALLAAADPGLYLTMLSELWQNGSIATEHVDQACRILGVDALLCVAIQGDRYGRFATNYDIFEQGETEILVDAAVFAPGDGLVANYSFEALYAKELDGYRDVGKLLRDAIEGNLARRKATLPKMSD